jgi:hypothetical protein
VARQTIRVVPDFGRTWVGLSTVTSCTETGQLGLCSGTYRVNTQFVDDLSLRQTRDLASGTLSLGTPLSVTGSVQLDGSLTLQGQGTARVGSANLTTTLSQYTTRVTSATRMAATYTFVVTTDQNSSRSQISFTSTYIGPSS